MSHANTSVPPSSRRCRTRLAPLVLALVAGLPAASSAAVLRSITVRPLSSSLAVSTARQFVAKANYSDGTSKDVTAIADWTTGSSRIAVVRKESPGRGIVTATGPGTTKVSAALVENGSKTKGSADLVVPTPPLQAIRTKPTTKRIEVGFDVAFQAIGDRGNEIADDITAQVIWRSTNTAVATVVATGPSAGLVHPVAPGQVQIIARDSATGIENTDGLTEVRARVVRLAVEPASLVLARRVRFPMRCYAIRADGSRSNITTDVSWTSDSTGVAIGTTAPEIGVVRSGSDGEAKIDCTDWGRGLTTIGSATATVTVAGRLVGLEVQPDPLVVAAGESRSAKVFGLLQGGGATSDLAEAVGWLVSDPEVATVSNVAGDRGEVTGLASGQATLAAVEPVTGIVSSGDGNLRVLGDILDLALDAGEGIVGRGESIEVRARATYVDGYTANVNDKCTWSSSKPSLATVSNTAPRGVVTGLARGEVVIEAVCPAGTASTPVRVAGDVVALRLSPAAIEGEARTAKRVKALATYEDGSERDASRSVAWSTGAPLVAALDPESPGTLNLLQLGSTTVRADHPAGPTASAPVTVTPGIVALEIVPAARTLRGSVQAKLRAQGRRADGTTKTLTKEVVWSSDDERIVRVADRAGEEGSIFGGATKGTTRVRAVLGDGQLEASIPVTLDVLLESFELLPAERTIPLLGARIVEARARFEDGGTKKINRSVLYQSSNPAVAFVSNEPGSQGLVTAVAAGSAVITAVDVSSGKVATNSVPVTVVP